MESIKEHAARWAIRADTGSLSVDEQRDLDTWLEADPRHRGAYVRARAQWVDLDRLSALNGRSSPVVDPPAMQEGSAGNAVAEKAGDRFGVSRRQLLAAGLAAVTIAGGGLSWLLLRSGAARYASEIGEVRRIGLEDGSTLILNTATEVTVELTPQQRTIRLIRGEALFEVAHDKSRPFIVMANDTAVRAVGTAFAVRLESSEVDVTVTEGVVEVATPARPANYPGGPPKLHPDTKRVTANEKIVVSSARAFEVQTIAVSEAERQLAWREGMVSFDGEALGVAVAEINRHNRRQIVIDDPALAAKPIVGAFRATDLEGFSETAATALKARAVPDGDVIRLQPGAAPPQN